MVLKLQRLVHGHPPDCFPVAFNKNISTVALLLLIKLLACYYI
jgi:hypothetical protein